jgi:hypothetical protein
MDWVPLQNNAKAKGQLVFAMRQSQTPAMTQPGPWGTSTDGYCIGLAATWIALQYQGKAFPTDASKVCDNPPWRSTLSQTLSDTTNAAKWLDYWTAATSPFQLRLSDGLRAKRDTMLTGNFIHSIVTQAYGCYGITVSGTGGVHALAMRHGRDNRMHFFDANFGHFAVKDHTQLKAFLDWFWQASGYANNFLESTAAITGVRPPIS